MGEGGRLEKPSTFKYFTASKRHSPKREGWLCAPVAQLVEQKTLNLRVGGSIPSRRSFVLSDLGLLPSILLVASFDGARNSHLSHAPPTLRVAGPSVGRGEPCLVGSRAPALNPPRR